PGPGRAGLVPAARGGARGGAGTGARRRAACVGGGGPPRPPGGRGGGGHTAPTGWLRTADPFTRTRPWTCTGMGVRAIGISVRSWIGDEDPIGRSAKPAAVTSPAYVRLANSGIRNSPVPFVVKTMSAPRSSVRLTRAPAIASPALTPLFRFTSR